MTNHVILGKGQIGSTVAAILAERGEQVRVLSRSGGESTALISHQRVDAGDRQALIDATAGADVIYNCANPAGYHQWARQWPPMAAALLAAAEQHGAGLVTTGNLYGYGPVDAPMTERTPLRSLGPGGQIRNDMWRDMRQRYEQGRVRVTEARASDYFGPGALSNAMLGDRVVPRVLAGKSVMLLGDPDALRSWTYIPDVARALVRLGGDDRSWGRPWHVPTAPAQSQRQMVEQLSRLNGGDTVPVRRMPWWPLINLVGAFKPAMRGFAETRHQFDGPFIMDSSDFTDTFGDKPTDTTEALAETMRWWRARTGR
jgi:nucleoside-diphosphate-sugar epimerase